MNQLYFDIGANKGEYTQFLLTGELPLHMAVQPCATKAEEKFVYTPSTSATVIAVEASKTECAGLSIRFSGTNVVVINKAISNVTNQALDFYVCSENELSTADDFWRTSSRFAHRGTWTKTVVQTITIDGLVEQYGVPQNIKLDVEGYEYMALQGMTKPYCPIKFEWAEEKVDELLLSIKHLADVGFRFFGATHGDNFDQRPTQMGTEVDLLYTFEELLRLEQQKMWGMCFAYPPQNVVKLSSGEIGLIN
jgi:FkbM family methyltransferase